MDQLSNHPPRIHLRTNKGVYSYVEEACELAEVAGTTVFPWQRDVLEDLLMVGADELWTAQHAAIVVARQNGKGEIIAVRELVGLFLLNERIIHTAHLVPTALEGFKRLLAMIESHPDLKREVKHVSFTNGREAIELKSGARINFMARSKGSARGFTVDLLVLDEAMMMPSVTVAALLPTISGVENPQVLYAGSAGDKEAEHLGRIRTQAIKHLADPESEPVDDLYYAEWSIDACTEFCQADCVDHDRLDSPLSYAKANPSLGLLQTVRKIEAERLVTDPVIFARERLSVGDWPVEDGAWRILDQDHWRARIDMTALPQKPLCFAVAVTPDRMHSCIVVASSTINDNVHIEIPGDDLKGIFDHRPGTQWVVPRLKELVDKWQPNTPVIIQRVGAAGALIPEAENLGLEIASPTATDYGQACGDMYAAVTPSTNNNPYLIHRDQPSLNAAVAGADRRDVAQLWGWARSSPSVDISPLEAATLAVWGHNKYGAKPGPVSPWVVVQ